MPSKKSNLGALVKGTAPSAAPLIQKGAGYRVGAHDADVELPPEVLALSQPLQVIARSYLGARRRSGEALLDMSRWLSEARDVAEHGEWQAFLHATGTAADTAERLLHIHTLAMQNPQFADSVKRDWLSQSAAALLARPSTPPEVIVEVLNAAEPPKVSAIERTIKRARRGEHADASAPASGPAPQNPQFADFAVGGEQPLTAEEMLHEVARVLAHLARDVRHLPRGATLFAALDQVDLALTELRREIEQ